LRNSREPNVRKKGEGERGFVEKKTAEVGGTVSGGVRGTSKPLHKGGAHIRGGGLMSKP